MKRPWLALIGAFCFIFIAVFLLVGILIVSALWPQSEYRGDNNIVVLKLEGVLVESIDFTRQLKTLGEEKGVKGVVIRINSPGGLVGPSQEIYDEIRKLREKKKVVASFGAIATSGAFYVACAADKIVSAPGTLTGSIGVILEFANLEKLFEWAKMQPYVVKSGQYKDSGSSYRAITPEEKRLFEELVQNVHSQFERAISDGRGMALEKVAEVSDGRILSGEQALNLGLVDQLGTLEDAIKLAAELAKVESPNIIYPKKERIRWWDFVFDEARTSLFGTRRSHFSGISPLLLMMLPTN